MPNHHKRHTPGRAPNNDPVPETPGAPEQPADAGAPAAVAAPPPAQPAPTAPAGAAAPAQPPPQTLKITDLKDLSIQKLTQIAKEKNVAGATGMRKQDLIFQILKAQTEQSGFIFSEGVLEVLPDGFGFLRA